MDVFFAAQDAAEAGRVAEAEALWTSLLECEDLLDGDAPDDEPPSHVLRSLACNALGEQAVDRALAAGFPLRPCPSEQQAASECFDRALRECPSNATAAMSAALLARDTGSSARALQLWAAAARALDDESGGVGEPWHEDWLRAAQRRAAPLARLYRALLLSQLGRHDEATPELCRLGFRWRLSPSVWDAARSPPPARAALAGAAEAEVESEAAPVRLYADAVDEGLYRALTRAFAPEAPYWRETGYEAMASSKRYFTFYVDLDDLRARASAPAHSVESLILSLLPLTGAPHLRACEWWVHRRHSGRGWGHELHYDVEEQAMEVSGRVLHPTVSSVVYLSGGADPTVVLDETLDAPLSAASARVAHPSPRSFLAFRGDLLHGVLPGPFAHHRADSVGGAGGAGNPAPPPPPRLTLLIAWYSEHTKGAARRSRLAAQSAVPRPTRSQTWPLHLPLTEEETTLHEGARREAAARGGKARRPAQLRVPVATPAWTAVPPPDGCAPPLAPPAELRQHFFLQRAGEVGERLQAEHGVGGSWGAAATARGRKRGRA